VQGLVLHHEGGLAEELDMAAPEDGEGLRQLLEPQKEELSGPQEDPGAVSKVAIDVSIGF
jgi:hypothetical protein